MVNVLSRSATLALCVLAFGWSAPLAGGSGTCLPSPHGGTLCPPSTTTSYSRVSSAFSLLVSPTRLVIGQTDIGRTQRFLVVNRGQESVAVTVTKRNFTGELNGAMDFRSNAPYSAANWLAITPANFDLAPGTAQAVVAAITMPDRPEPGDHQVALVFLVPGGRNGAGITINRGIATPIYITVPGAASDTATIDGLSAPGFMTGGSADITARINDVGTVHRDFRGATRLTVSTAGDVAPFPDFTVLRDSTREVSTAWTPPLMCICHPSVSFRNADGSVQSASVRVIVFPIYQALAILAIVVLGLFFFRWRYRKRHAAVTGAHRPQPTGSDDV